MGLHVKPTYCPIGFVFLRNERGIEIDLLCKIVYTYKNVICILFFLNAARKVMISAFRLWGLLDSGQPNQIA